MQQEDFLIQGLMKAEEQIARAENDFEVESFRERYINIIDLICYKYNKKKIDKDFVELCLKSIIKEAVELDDYKEFVNKEYTPNLIKFYDNKIKKQ